ncbi:MAG: LysR family transcriptional regulator [Pseudomonadota bacterium]
MTREMARCGSFAAATRALALDLSAVNRAIAGLDRHLDSCKSLPSLASVWVADAAGSGGVSGSGGCIIRQAGLFGLSEHLERLSKDGDPLDVLEATVDFEYVRPWLVEGLGYGDGSKGGRPSFDPVSMVPGVDGQGADPAGPAHPLGRAEGVHACRHLPRNCLSASGSATGSRGCGFSASTLARRHRTRTPYGISGTG